MKVIFKLSEKTKKETNGYFDIFYKGKYDPSGIVKGWVTGRTWFIGRFFLKDRQNWGLEL